MRIQVALTILLFSLSAMAVDEKTVGELFKKYDLVMDEKKVELVDEIFTKKFLRETGGKEKFVEGIKSLPVDKKAAKTKVTWKKAPKGDFILAKPAPKDAPEFVLKKEDGKLKIDATVGDDG